MRRWTFRWGVTGAVLALVVGVSTALLAAPEPGVGSDRPRFCQAFDASRDRAWRLGPVGPAGPEQTPQYAAEEEPPVDVVVIGDSYASGWKLADVADAWPARLAETLPGRVRMAGYPGSGFAAKTSECGEHAFADRVGDALVPGTELVVVQGGLNDVDQSAAAVEAGFTRLLEEVGDVPLVVVGPPTAPARVAGALRVDAQLSGLAGDHGIPYVATAELELPYLDDDLHLDAKGHRVLAEVVAGALADH